MLPAAARKRFRSKKIDMKKRAQQLAETVLTPKFCKKFNFGGPLPISMGLNGYVYASSLPGMVIKLTCSKREALLAQHIKETTPSYISAVHEVMFGILETPWGEVGHLIYIEQLEKPNLKVRKALEKLLHKPYMLHGGTERPKEVLAHVIDVVEKAPPGSTLLKVAKQLVRIFKGMYKHNVWHVDMHADNMMINKDGTLKLIDIAALKALNIPEKKV